MELGKLSKQAVAWVHVERLQDQLRYLAKDFLLEEEELWLGNWHGMHEMTTTPPVPYQPAGRYEIEVQA